MSNDIGTLLEAAARESGILLAQAAAEVTAYAAVRTAHLAAITGEPGFDEALAAEVDSVSLYAGISSVAEADAADSRLRGIIEGVLMASATGGF